METQQEVKNTGPRCLAGLHWIRDTIADVQEKREIEKTNERERGRKREKEREREKERGRKKAKEKERVRERGRKKD
jgi:hypothetical protein